MIQALTLILVYQLAGETLRVLLHLPVPGPVLGMVGMLVHLTLRGGPSHELRGTAGTLLQHLSLLFVPAGTGVMLHLHRLQSEWFPILAALLGSTVLGLLVTGLVLRMGLRRGEGHD